MKKLTPTLAALLLAACGPAKDDPAQQFRDALPKAETAHVGNYQDAGAAAAAGAMAVARQGLGDSAIAQSEYAVMSYYLALSVNGGASVLLNLVRFITLFPTTSCDATSCTWGPWSGDAGFNNYKLQVTKVSGLDGVSYEYVLSGQNALVADAPFVAILTGVAHPLDRDRGTGSFTLDFDNQWNGLAHPPGDVQKDFGQLDLEYDNTTQVPFVDATFLGARNQDPDPANQYFVNARYHFVAAASGGELQIAFENLTSHDTVTMRTRWSASGQGRADVLFTAGAGGSLTASECWAGRSQDWAEVYDTKHLDIPQLQDANGCAPFTTFQEADIQLP